MSRERAEAGVTKIGTANAQGVHFRVTRSVLIARASTLSLRARHFPSPAPAPEHEGYAASRVLSHAHKRIDPGGERGRPHPQKAPRPASCSPVHRPVSCGPPAPHAPAWLPHSKAAPHTRNMECESHAFAGIPQGMPQPHPWERGHPRPRRVRTRASWSPAGPSPAGLQPACGSMAAALQNRASQNVHWDTKPVTSV
ncbi:hypothetical protein HRbin30_02050 [bacterium HR30]|nr:hypothetical protein HRbin30_02050 [bacterium HR30]